MDEEYGSGFWIEYRFGFMECARKERLLPLAYAEVCRCVRRKEPGKAGSGHSIISGHREGRGLEEMRGEMRTGVGVSVASLCLFVHQITLFGKMPTHNNTYVCVCDCLFPHLSWK